MKTCLSEKRKLLTENSCLFKLRALLASCVRLEAVLHAAK